MDRRTDRPSYRDAWLHLKMTVSKNDCLRVCVSVLPSVRLSICKAFRVINLLIDLLIDLFLTPALEDATVGH